jgi:hypothetical protein
MIDAALAAQYASHLREDGMQSMPVFFLLAGPEPRM